MKIKAEDKVRLFELLDNAIERIGRDTIAEHKALKLGDDKEKRFRWDVFWASRIKIGDGIGTSGDLNLYSYMDDSHIDTALKAYVRERGL